MIGRGLVGAAVSWLLTGPAAGVPGAAPVPRCGRNADTARVAVEQVRLALSFGDSAEIVQAGFPYDDSAAVSLVTREQTCQEIIEQFNALYPAADSLKRISAGYVIRAGEGFVLYFYGKNDSLWFFDSSKRFRHTLVGI